MRCVASLARNEAYTCVFQRFWKSARAGPCTKARNSCGAIKACASQMNVEACAWFAANMSGKAGMKMMGHTRCTCCNTDTTIALATRCSDGTANKASSVSPTSSPSPSSPAPCKRRAIHNNGEPSKRSAARTASKNGLKSIAPMLLMPLAPAPPTSTPAERPCESSTDLLQTAVAASRVSRTKTSTKTASTICDRPNVTSARQTCEMESNSARGRG
mmetsp:Transcript_69237/g.192794  ORF Transcript_69237/g.192794 Transcript_69237/m.192794 type:complete len:216 (+) Transcript_69237:1154-1801(+)